MDDDALDPDLKDDSLVDDDADFDDPSGSGKLPKGKAKDDDDSLDLLADEELSEEDGFDDVEPEDRW